MEIRNSRRHRLGVRTESAHVQPAQTVSTDQRNGAAQRSEHETLIEDQVRVVAVLPATRLCDERHRPHTQDLGDGHHEELHITRGSHSGDGGIAELGHEVEVDQHVEGLKDHADRDRHGHPHDVARDGALGHVLHRWSGTFAGGSTVDVAPRPRSVQRRGRASCAVRTAAQ